VPILPDDQFESYLRRFRPLAPEALPKHIGRRTWSMAVLAAWAAAAAIMLGAVMLTISPRLSQTHSPLVAEKRAEPSAKREGGAAQLVNPQPLTIRSANALLATAPSLKAALDEMAFPPHAAPAPKDKRSALAELAEEKTKL
jgi:hypothetical protein